MQNVFLRIQRDGEMHHNVWNHGGSRILHGRRKKRIKSDVLKRVVRLKFGFFENEFANRLKSFLWMKYCSSIKNRERWRKWVEPKFVIVCDLIFLIFVHHYSSTKIEC